MAVIHMNFLSKQLGFQTNITVCLPTMTMSEAAEGDRNVYVPGMKYQVLYLLHGGSGDDQDYIHFTNIVRYADKHKLCVVMPSGYNSRYTDARPGFGPRYFRYLAEELPLVCETLFPISTKREDTFAAGLSMGGQGAMRLGVMNPEKYSTILCMSGASFNPDKVKSLGRPIGTGEDSEDAMPTPNAEAMWGDLDSFKGSINDTWHYAKVNAGQKRIWPEFYYVTGDQDATRPVLDDAYNYMTELGCPTHYELVSGYGHEWDLWDRTLRKALDEKWFPLKDNSIMPE